MQEFLMHPQPQYLSKPVLMYDGMGVTKNITFAAIGIFQASPPQAYILFKAKKLNSSEGTTDQGKKRGPRIPFFRRKRTGFYSLGLVNFRIHCMCINCSADLQCRFAVQSNSFICTEIPPSDCGLSNFKTVLIRFLCSTISVCFYNTYQRTLFALPQAVYWKKGKSNEWKWFNE